MPERGAAEHSIFLEAFAAHAETAGEKIVVVQPSMPLLRLSHQLAADIS